VEQADDVAARLGNSGDISRVLRCAGTATSDADGFLTSKRVSGAAPRRLDSGDGEESTAAAES
jgi:hypothetical protein